MEIKNKFLFRNFSNFEIKKIAIIGAGGEMGTWFAKFFSREGITVFASDKVKKNLSELKKETKINLAKSNKEVVKSADLILVSVLFKDFETVVKEISPELKENQIVIDITSLKEKPVQIMHRFLKKNLILGTHPLFGPGVKAPKQNFVLTPTDSKEKLLAKDFGSWLRERGFNVIMLSPQKHDEIMAIILGLPHFVGLAAGSTLSKLDIRELKKIAGPSFNKLLDLVQNVAFSSPDFYSELHLNLPKINKIEETFEKEVRTWREIVKNKEGEKFIEKMCHSQNFFQKF